MASLLNSPGKAPRPASKGPPACSVTCVRSAHATPAEGAHLSLTEKIKNNAQPQLPHPHSTSSTDTTLWCNLCEQSLILALESHAHQTRRGRHRLAREPTWRKSRHRMVPQGYVLGRARSANSCVSIHLDSFDFCFF